MSKYENLVDSVLSKDAFIMYNKKIAHKVGVNAAILIGDLISKRNSFRDKKMIQEDGSFFNTRENIEKDTALSFYQQKVSAKDLENAGLISIKMRGLPRKKYFKLNDKKIFEILQENSVLSNPALVPSCSQKSAPLAVKKVSINKNNLIKISSIRSSSEKIKNSECSSTLQQNNSSEEINHAVKSTSRDSSSPGPEVKSARTITDEDIDEYFYKWYLSDGKGYRWMKKFEASNLEELRKIVGEKNPHIWNITRTDILDIYLKRFKEKFGTYPESIEDYGKINMDRFNRKLDSLIGDWPKINAKHSPAGIHKIIREYFDDKKNKRFHIDIILSDGVLKEYSDKIRLNPQLHSDAMEYNLLVF